jgi:hypothetical protein
MPLLLARFLLFKNAESALEYFDVVEQFARVYS